MTISRARHDRMTEASPDSRQIARLTGINGATLTVETIQFIEDSANQESVGGLILIHGPQGGEKYRIATSKAAINTFARELLAGKQEKESLTPKSTAEPGSSTERVELGLEVMDLAREHGTATVRHWLRAGQAMDD